MIVVELNGGIGNQLFQYAAGRALAQLRNTILKFDINLYHEDNIRKFILDKLRLFSGRYLIFGNKKKLNFVQEKTFRFDSSFFNIPDNSYLSGYWQSEKYFKKIDSQLRSELKPIFKFSNRSRLYLEKIKVNISISIHFRLKDYLKDKKTQDYHGFCGWEFYQKALLFLNKKNISGKILIFSDECSWVKNNWQLNLPQKNVIFIESENSNIQNDIEDLLLMSYCHYNIIANSSFSWWAAWLNPHPRKIILAPKKWFNDSSIDTRDLYPKNWVKL